MKILVFASLTPPATANYLISSLRDAGHELFVCSDVPSPLVDLRARGAVDVARVCARQGLAPDLVLFVEGGTMRLFPTGLDRMPCLTAWYGIDTHMDYAKHLCIGRLFDVTFIAQQEFVERLRQDGLRQVHWLPLGFAPELMPVPLPPRSLDIAHVGSSNVSANPLRHALISVLRREFPSSYFGPASPQDMGRIYASAWIVFNRSVNNDVNMRFFEAAGAGAVLVTNHIIDNGVEALFEEDVHYAVYRDEASLLDVVQTLLADPARCEAMGRAARERVLERHTYRHRADALLAELALSVKVARPGQEGYFAAFLALDMLGVALDAAARAMAATSGGKYRKIAGGAAAAVLRGLGCVLDLVERIRKH
jgi:hypothetical protein